MPTYWRPAFGSVTPSSGTASFTLITMQGMIRQIYVKTTTSTTTFDLKITDADSHDIYTSTDETGVLNERLELPTFSNTTVTIENASADEAFTYHFALEE